MLSKYGVDSVLKVAESGGARTADWRNRKRGMTRANDVLWIDPELFPCYQRTFRCVFHKRTRAVALEAVSQNVKRRKRVSFDKDCGFRVVLTTTSMRKSLQEDVSYNMKMNVYAHNPNAETDEVVFANGHNHNTRRSSPANNILPQNKRLLPHEKQRVRELSGYGMKPREILLQIGGTDAGDHRTRTTKSISNLTYAEKRKLYGSPSTVAVDMDLTVKYLSHVGAKFWIYCAKPDNEEVRLSEKDFLGNSVVTRVCDGAQFKDLHVLFPGCERMSALYGDCVSVDSTHNMCSARFPLYLGMVGDTNGKGHIITVSLLSTESARAVGHALQFQKERAGMTHRSILLDKDGTEFSAIADVLPAARLVLCRFHSIKYFRLAIAVQYLPVELRDAAVGEWRKMVYARSVSEFVSAWEMLSTICRDVNPISHTRYPCSPPTIID